jgi:hypothetical protein
VTGTTFINYFSLYLHTYNHANRWGLFVLIRGIEDPKGKPIKQVKEIRDDIEQRVMQLVTNLPKR